MMRIAVLVLLLLATAAPARADYQSAVLSYDQGRFDSALSEFHGLAEQGHAGAEFMLGAMFFYGKGVASNHILAAIWFHKSAIKGNASAQLAFGSLHIRGIGVRQDLVTAYTWLTIAANNGIPGLQQQAIALRDEAARLMRPEEVAMAEAAARDFAPRRAGLVRTN